MPGDQDQVIVTGTAGPPAAGLMNRTAPLDGSLAGQVISAGKPSLVTGDRLQTAAAALGTGIGPLIAVPLAADERILGALLLGRLAARPGFTEADLGMAASFAGLHARIMEIIEEHAPQLGFTASASFAGPPDPEPDESLAHDILAVTREALSNCARHARATAVTVTLDRHDGLITLDITDNGCGLGTPPAPAA